MPKRQRKFERFIIGMVIGMTFALGIIVAFARTT